MRKTLRSLSAVLVVAVLAAACGSSTAKAVKPRPPVDSGPKLVGKGVRPAPPSGELVRAAAEGEERFAVALYRELATDSGNVAIAPSSIATVLGMIAAGARGTTEQQLIDALHVQLPASQLHRAIGGLAQVFAERNGDGVTLNEVDQAWLQQGLSVLGPYADTLAGSYNAPLATIDFARAATAAATINTWFDRHTHGKIPKLIDAGDLDSATALVLTDAVYLDAQWRFGFDPKLTAPAPFHTPGGAAVSVPTMHNDPEQTLGYASGPGWAAVALPYVGKQLEMDVIAPDDLHAFEAGLSGDHLASILASLRSAHVALALPRWDSRVQTDLVGPLQRLGIKDAFSTTAADLSGIDGKHDLYVSDVKHEAVVHVDEKGTVAAGATAGVVQATAGIRATVMNVDQPFVYVVRDVATGAILFLGRVTDPRS
jgi:serpin B